MKIQNLKEENSIKEKIYKEIKDLLENENEEYTNRIKLLENERDKIKESIVNQDYYENVKIIAVYLKELEEKRKLNDILVNENS